MDISNIAFKLIVILMPGIIATLLTKNLTVTKNWDSFKFSIYTILFSGISYLLLQVLYSILTFLTWESGYNSATLEVWSKSTEDGDVPYYEVLLACLLSIFVGLLSSRLIRKKTLFEIAKKIGVSYKFGDENLFYHFMRDDKTSSIYIKDIENNITYHGYIDSYSESDTIREVVLKDVDVYSYTESKPCYFAPRVYLSQSINKNWIIELPNIKFEEDDVNKDGREAKA